MVRTLKDTLRETHLTIRNQLTEEQVQTASIQLCAHLNPLLANQTRIATYIAMANEANPAYIKNNETHQLFAPRILSLTEKTMGFFPYKQTTILKNNALDILEPQDNTHQTVSPQTLDMILLPLVCFDHAGARIGMGGGYYDRILATAHKPPLLIGIAFDCQRCEHIPSDPWDIPLDYVVTESGVTKTNNSL